MRAIQLPSKTPAVAPMNVGSEAITSSNGHKLCELGAVYTSFRTGSSKPFHLESRRRTTAISAWIHGKSGGDHLRVKGGPDVRQTSLPYSA